jgi:nitroreductase
MEQTLLTAIKNRRSVREFTKQPVEAHHVREILHAGIWAPSGLNNQPWRFVLISAPERRTRLAELTHYASIVLAAPLLIAVYLDQEKMYDALKDQQAAGACIQNMLLAAHALQLGAVWLGQILKNKEKVNEVLEVSSRYDLMALLAVGHPQHSKQSSQRLPLEDFILHEFGGSTP